MSKKATAAPKAGRVGFARAVEASVEGEAPEAARLWKAGWNRTEKGDLNFTERSAKLVMQAYEDRNTGLAWYYEHEDMLPLEKRGGAPMKGVCSAPSSALTIRDSPDGPECWSESIAWTAEARRQINSGERRQLSPVAWFDLDTREITGIKNISLCAEGATMSGTLLASVAKGTNMDELIQAICDAAAAMDFEKVEALCAQAEAMGNEGGAAAAKMGRAMAKMATGGEEKKPEPKPEPMVASRVLRPVSGNAEMLALSRELAESKAQSTAALKEAKVGRVEGLIATNRDCFDAADERVHLRRADPDATREHIDSIKRKGTGTLAAGRAGASDAKPPKDKPTGDDPTFGLRADQIETVDRMNAGKARMVSDGKGGMVSNPKLLTLEAFARSQAQQKSKGDTRNGTVA